MEHLKSLSLIPFLSNLQSPLLQQYLRCTTDPETTCLGILILDALVSLLSLDVNVHVFRHAPLFSSSCS